MNGHYRSYAALRSQGRSFPAKPDGEESDQYPDPINLNIPPFRGVIVIDPALCDLNRERETKYIQCPRSLLCPISAQQQGHDSRQSEQDYMENQVPGSMRGRPHPDGLER